MEERTTTAAAAAAGQHVLYFGKTDAGEGRSRRLSPSQLCRPVEVMGLLGAQSVVVLEESDGGPNHVERLASVNRLSVVLTILGAVRDELRQEAIHGRIRGVGEDVVREVQVRGLERERVGGGEYGTSNAVTYGDGDDRTTAGRGVCVQYSPVIIAVIARFARVTT